MASVTICNVKKSYVDLQVMHGIDLNSKTNRRPKDACCKNEEQTMLVVS